MLAEAPRLEPMLGQVLAYGTQHSDQFGSYGLIWHEDGSASVFVSFTADLNVHRSASRRPSTIPDDSIVCQVAVNEATAHNPGDARPRARRAGAFRPSASAARAPSRASRAATRSSLPAS